MSKILVIDDEKITLRMFGLFLEAYGYEMLPAESGEQGLDLFRRERPKLVLTDIKMPTMDGLEVLQKIKEIDPETEVIVITGHGDMDLAIKALNLDAADFVNKPIKRDSLEKALQRATERMELNRAEKKSIGVSREEDTAIISFRGNITSASEPFLKRARDKALDLHPERIVLCFDPNVSINGAGLSAMAEFLEELRTRSKEVHAAGLSENFKEVFRQIGLMDKITLHDSMDEALDTIQ
ncbi:MAG: response regulator [Desulfonatronovibrionaceae bacterium]